MNANELALMIAGLLVPVLSALWKAWHPEQAVKLWVELAVAIIIAYVAAVILGAIPLVPNFGEIPWTDPLKAIEALTAVIATLIGYWEKIFSIAVVVYLFLKEKLEAAAIRVKIFAGRG